MHINEINNTPCFRMHVSQCFKITSTIIRFIIEGTWVESFMRLCVCCVAHGCIVTCHASKYDKSTPHVSRQSIMCVYAVVYIINQTIVSLFSILIKYSRCTNQSNRHKIILPLGHKMKAYQSSWYHHALIQKTVFCWSKSNLVWVYLQMCRLQNYRLSQLKVKILQQNVERLCEGLYIPSLV